MMGKSILLTGAALTVLAVFPAAAQQQMLEDRIRALEQKLGQPAPNDNQPLEDRVKALEQKLEQKTDDDQAVRTRLSTHEQQFADTVCKPTKDRQSALRKLIEIADAIVVVGGRTSNNTRQLVETCRAAGKIAFHIERPDELRVYAEKLERFDQAVRYIRQMDDPALTDAGRVKIFVLPDGDAVARLAVEARARGLGVHSREERDDRDLRVSVGSRDRGGNAFLGRSGRDCRRDQRRGGG